MSDMPELISVLEHKPVQLVREVSPGALDFFVRRLSGMYVPDDFRKAHPHNIGVEFWNISDRLKGKFGRYAFTPQDTDAEPIDDVLLMGPMVGVCNSKGNGITTLEHPDLDKACHDIIHERSLVGEVEVKGVDYGYTEIELDEDATPLRVIVKARSTEFGRADTAGRQTTCDMFAGVLGHAIEVINHNPDPDPRRRIISSGPNTP